MCGARETPWDCLNDEVVEQLDDLIKKVMNESDRIMKEDPDCQPYETPDDKQRMTDSIEFIEQALEMIKTDCSLCEGCAECENKGDKNEASARA